MMMTQQFPGHQLGMAHPNMPQGHPMPHHPGAPHMGGQAPAMGMVPGMHPGVSGPQVSQGQPMVTGIPPGASTPAPGPMPSQHAMSHLGPGQQQMFQQQHPQMNFANPHMIQQHQQAQILRQRMMQQQAQGQQPGGIPGVLPNGQTITPQQMQAMQQARAGMQNHMNFHMQQQLQGHPQMSQQHPQNMHPHQQHLLQQSQANHAAAMQDQRHAQQMMRMQTGQTPTTQPPQPQPTPTPQVTQAPPQPSQPPQSQPTPPQQPQQPHTPQQQQPQPQQQQQPPPPPPQPQQQQQQQQGQQNNQASQQSNQQRVEQAKQNAAFLQQQQQRALNSMNSMSIKGNQILFLNSFFDWLSNVESHNANDIDFWQKFVGNFFSETGVLRQQIWESSSGNDKTYRIAYAVLPRYYLNHFTSGVTKITMQMDQPRENELTTGGHLVFSNRCQVTYWFRNDTHLVTQGGIRANIDVQGKIETLEITVSKQAEYIPRAIAQHIMDSPEMKTSPEINKKKKAAQKQVPTVPNSASLPTSLVNDWGVTAPVMQFLEVAEITTIMGPLLNHSQQHPTLTPEQALSSYVEQLNNIASQQDQRLQNVQQGNLNATNMPQRAAGLQAPNQFASPAIAHLGLPNAGSPHVGGPVHTPSPAQTHMAGPVAMVHQQSQQGSNMSGSQGTSANTSPNVTNKRRRPSGAVKTEGEDGGGDVNGITNPKVKQSPRVGKRQKPGP